MNSQNPSNIHSQTSDMPYTQFNPSFHSLLTNPISPSENFTNDESSHHIPFISIASSHPYVFDTPSQQQYSETPPCQSPAQEESSKKSKIKWSKEATVLLISGWLNTSKDAIIGNDQTSSNFWERIATYFNKNSTDEQIRTGQQCRSHWNKTNRKVAQFNGCYKRVQQARHSGWSDDQIFENALEMYKAENKNSKFQLIECWRLLKDEPKWSSTHQNQDKKRTKLSEAGHYATSSNADVSDLETSEVRPIGQKAAKRKDKEKKEMHDTYIEVNARKASALEKLVAIKEKEAEDQRITKYMDYLVMDTSHMTTAQKNDHELLCNHIKLNILKF